MSSPATLALPTWARDRDARVAGANLIPSGRTVAPRRLTRGGPRPIPGIVPADPSRVGIAPEEGYGAPSDDHAARMLATIVPPDSTRNRLPHAPDGVLSRKNHLLARLQPRVDRSGHDTCPDHPS
jgi:hypothetical protein